MHDDPRYMIQSVVLKIQKRKSQKINGGIFSAHQHFETFKEKENPQRN